LVLSPPRDRPIACAPFFFARRRYVGEHVRLSHQYHVFIVVIARQHLENALENPALGPSAEALVHRFPVTKPLG
jgi:hypothetical protein